MGKRSILFGSVILLFLLATQTTSNLIEASQTGTGDDLTSFSLSQSVAIEEGVVSEKPLVTHAPPIAQDSRVMSVWATAYTSHPDETDDTPFITASGSYVRDGVAAANFLPIGTEFKLPELFGERVFVVEDRMNARYNNVHIVDIWFDNKIQAIDFGKRKTTIEIL